MRTYQQTIYTTVTFLKRLLNNRKALPHSSAGPISEIKVLAELLLSEACERESVHLLTVCWISLVFFGL